MNADADQLAIVKKIQKRANDLGFSAFGITAPDASPDMEKRLRASIAEGHMAGMSWMQDTVDRRASPKALWPDVRSIIMVGMNYGPSSNPLDDLAHKDRANISVYARHDDYHELIKGRLKEIAGLLARLTDSEVKVFVDTAPVMEKPLAEAAGLGWQGKHSALVSKACGSWLFLGSIFTAADLPKDQMHAENCGTCTKCMDVCPTNAFPQPFRLDASKCLAYYSNEHHGMVPEQFRKPMGNRVFGCDDCLAVCPWNKFAKTTKEIRLQARQELSLPHLADLSRVSESEFKALTKKTPLRRLGYARFLRNLLIAIGNSASADLSKEAVRHLKNQDPVVRGTAVWAIKQLLSAEAVEKLRADAERVESDRDVLHEWAA